LPAGERIALTVDPGTFEEMWGKGKDDRVEIKIRAARKSPR